MACLSFTLVFCKQSLPKAVFTIKSYQNAVFVIFVEDLLQSSRIPQLVARVEGALDADIIRKLQ